MSRNRHNKVNKDRDKFGYNIINNSREVLLLNKKNANTLWDDDIAKEMVSFKRLSVCKLYLPKLKFDKKDGW